MEKHVKSPYDLEQIKNNEGISLGSNSHYTVPFKALCYVVHITYLYLIKQIIYINFYLTEAGSALQLTPPEKLNSGLVTSLCWYHLLWLLHLIII
jgi:hypothetical protein